MAVKSGEPASDSSIETLQHGVVEEVLIYVALNLL